MCPPKIQSTEVRSNAALLTMPVTQHHRSDCSREGWEDTAEGESVHTKRKCRASNDRVDSRLCGSRSARILLAVGVALYLPKILTMVSGYHVPP